MSAHAQPEHGPVPPSSPNKNLALPETDPAQIDPKFAGNRSISGPLYSTQKPATQKAGRKDQPETHGRVSSAIHQHNFSQVVNIGPEKSLRPEVSDSQDPSQIAAEYIVWLAQSYEPSRFRSKFLGGRRVPRLTDGVGVEKLTEVFSGSDDATLAPVIARLEKVAIDHNTVATINGGAIVGPLLSEGDSVVPARVQEKINILSDKGLYSRTRRKARKLERNALKTVSHMVGAGSLTAPELDPRSRASKAVKKDTTSMHDTHHHAHTALYDKFPRSNRRLAFKATPALIREVNHLVHSYETANNVQPQENGHTDEVDVEFPTPVPPRKPETEAPSATRIEAGTTDDERLQAISGSLRFFIEKDDKVTEVTDAKILRRGTVGGKDTYLVEYTDASGNKQQTKVHAKTLRDRNLAPPPRPPKTTSW